MLKKTLLSLAIAATTVGLAGCNLSTTDQHDSEIVNQPVGAGNASMPAAVGDAYPIFDPANAKVPMGIDFLFGINSQLSDGQPGKDGTANTADTSAVTTAINKLDGFSTVAAMYIDVNRELDDTTVNTANVKLFRLLNAKDDTDIDPLDFSSILKAAAKASGQTEINQIALNAAATAVDVNDYEVNQIEYLNGGFSIQILPKKPLEPKTKYMVVLTSDILDEENGTSLGKSSEYVLLQKSDTEAVLPSSALTGARSLVRAWTNVAAVKTLNKAVFSYTFTTGGGADVLKAMAAPGIFLSAQLPTYEDAEKAILKAKGGNQTVADANYAAIAQSVGAQLNAAKADDNDWTVLPTDGTVLRNLFISNEDLLPYYHTGLITAIASNPADANSPTLLDNLVDKPKSRTYTQIMQSQTDAVAVSYDAFFTAQIKAKIEADVRSAYPENTPEATIDAAIDAAITANLSTLVTASSSKGIIYQGGLTIPNYLALPSVGAADSALGSWTANDNAAKALGLSGAPKDFNGTTNVTYRFPFAKKEGEITVPVMVTLPDATKCGFNAQAGDKWPVAIYQHGITADRTAGVLVGNALANACVAMVAIDHVMHGVGPTSATGLLFNVEKVSKNYNPASGYEATAAHSPFAIARAGMVRANANSPVASLSERHNNVGKNASQQNVAMVFKDAAGVTAAANVGASGDLYINLSNFSRTRDAMRQTVVDLLNLSASLGDIDSNADGKKDFDTSKVYFIGHSLGGIIGTTFVAVNNDEDVRTYNKNLPKIQAAILGNAGGGVVKLLENSPGIGALKILPGLKAAAELEQGSSDLEKFFAVFQAMLDSVDPINFASASHMQALPVLAYTAVNDNVVPNHTLGSVKYTVGLNNGQLEITGVDVGGALTAKSHLSGTAPLLTALNITSVVNGSTPEAAKIGARLSIRTDKDESDHTTFSSANYEDTFKEIFKQIGSFLADKLPDNSTANPLRLQGINVTDNSVLEQSL